MEHNHKYTYEQVMAEVRKVNSVMQSADPPCVLEAVCRILFEPENTTDQDRRIVVGLVLALTEQAIPTPTLVAKSPEELIAMLRKATKEAGFDMEVVRMPVGPETIH